ncbi:hypothetical protein C1E23_09690 [Pseudoalteromonas phenolica]|uniref:Uncharacterized protein n=1 Tax=Pseudoalteromonas phenolica TaxID=161398 RepID=A0A4Q7IN40_9GAMM|nr:hypothetical protein C1E23_09690 [Pseudoalteromonas phenolica]
MVVVTLVVTAKGLIISQVVSLAFKLFDDGLIRLNDCVDITVFAANSSLSAFSCKSVTVFYAVAVSFADWGHHEVTTSRIFTAVKLKSYKRKGYTKFFI